MIAIVYCPVSNFWSLQTLHRWVWGGRAVQNEVFIDYKQILPNLPLIHPEKAVSSICLAKREDALGIEQIKPLFSSASFSTWQASGVPSTAPPSLSSSWPPVSLFIARMNPAWYPGCPEPGNFRKLSCPQPLCLREDQQASLIWLFRRARLRLRLPLTVSCSVLVPGVQRTSLCFSLAV